MMLGFLLQVYSSSTRLDESLTPHVSPAKLQPAGIVHYTVYTPRVCSLKHASKHASKQGGPKSHTPMRRLQSVLGGTPRGVPLYTNFCVGLQVHRANVVHSMLRSQIWRSAVYEQCSRAAERQGVSRC